MNTSKYYAIMRNDETILSTVKIADDGSQEEAERLRSGWALHFTDDVITIREIARRAQAEQLSVHGVTEARGWN